MKYSKIINHLGEDRDQYKHSVAPPIFQSSNFSFSSVEEMRKGLAREFEEPFYTRGNNPTVEILRKKIAALEQAEDALVFSSGSGAISAAVMNSVKQGDHVLCVYKPYSWTKKLLGNLLSKYGVMHTFVEINSVADVERNLQHNTKLILLESPNSITFEVQDIHGICSLARLMNIRTIVDNSYCTPIFQQPITLGADIVCHSASKYISGHSDVVAGIICSSAEIIRSIFEQEYMTLGGNISPFDAWLILRGLRTLKIRVEASDRNGQKVFDFLSNHPKIAKVYYPFNPSQSSYETARKQMSGCGGLISIELATEDTEKIEQFCNSLKLFLLACSWGGYESLQFPQITLYGSQNYVTTLPKNLIRLYVGLEDIEDLLADLAQALDKI